MFIIQFSVTCYYCSGYYSSLLFLSSIYIVTMSIPLCYYILVAIMIIICGLEVKFFVIWKLQLMLLVYPYVSSMSRIAV